MHLIADHQGHAVLTLQRGQEWNMVREMLRSSGIKSRLNERPHGVDLPLSSSQRLQLAGELKRKAASARKRYMWGYAAILSRWARLLHDA